MDVMRAESYAHESDRDVSPVAVIAMGGAFFRIQAGKCYRKEMVHGKRGEIRSFSPASRRRLMTLMASIDRTAFKRRPLFVTLTYPKKWPASPRVYKADLNRFLTRFRRRYPHVPIIWRLEYQERGAPHYHLMIFTPWFIDWRWIAETWYIATERRDYLTLVAGTETRAVRSWKGVMAYAAKYMSKERQLPDAVRPGRLWGIHCREDLPIRLVTIHIDWAHFATLQQWLWAWHAGNGREVLHRYRTKGVSAYMSNSLATSMVTAAAP
jgi:hypothetical protein